MKTSYAVNQQIQTPNGPGVVTGAFDLNGQPALLVRHKLTDMTSTSAGVCMTPLARISGLYVYTLEALIYYQQEENHANPTR